MAFASSLRHIWTGSPSFGHRSDMINSMRLSFTTLLILRTCHATPVDAPRGSDDHTIQQTTPLSSPASSAILNSSYLSDQDSVPVNATPEDSPRIKCDGKSYGFDPNIDDCMTAIQYFLPSRVQTTYAQRGTPAQRGVVFPLPLRIMGGMYYSF